MSEGSKGFYAALVAFFGGCVAGWWAKEKFDNGVADEYLEKNLKVKRSGKNSEVENKKS